MKILVLTLILGFTSNLFAIEHSAKCGNEFSEMQAARKQYIEAVDKITKDANNTASYIMRVANHLIRNQGTIVGQYGYHLERNAKTAAENVKFYSDLAKIEEEKVNHAIVELENCLVNDYSVDEI